MLEFFKKLFGSTPAETAAPYKVEVIAVSKHHKEKSLER